MYVILIIVNVFYGFWSLFNIFLFNVAHLLPSRNPKCHETGMIMIIIIIGHFQSQKKNEITQKIVS